LFVTMSPADRVARLSGVLAVPPYIAPPAGARRASLYHRRSRQTGRATSLLGQ